MRPAARREEIGILLPNHQRQHRTFAHPEGFAAQRIVLVTVPRVGRSCEHFPDGLDLHLLLGAANVDDARGHQQLLALSIVYRTSTAPQVGVARHSRKLIKWTEEQL